MIPWRIAITTLVLMGALAAMPGNPTGAAANQASPTPFLSSFSDGPQVPLAQDLCPDVAEDEDGVDDLDGCPDTDVFVSASKDEAYSVELSQAETKTVNITVENGNYPADLLVHLLSVSTMGSCEVTLVAEPGDDVFPLVTDEDGDTVDETYFYLLEWDISLGAGESYQTSRDYSVVCHQTGQHSFELQVDSVPWPPVEEEDVEDRANVHKNFPLVTVVEGLCGDSDGDGFSDCEESSIGTLSLAGCAATVTPGDEDPDSAPPDFNDDRVVNLTDFFEVLPPNFGQTSGSGGFSQRRDLVPDGVINISDVIRLLPPVFGSSCG